MSTKNSTVSSTSHSTPKKPPSALGCSMIQFISRSAGARSSLLALPLIAIVATAMNLSIAPNSRSSGYSNVGSFGLRWNLNAVKLLWALTRA